MARHRYYTIRSYHDLVGRPLFDYHGELPAEKIKAIDEKLKRYADEVLLSVNLNDLRLYADPVRNEDGELVGYFRPVRDEPARTAG